MSSTASANPTAYRHWELHSFDSAPQPKDRASPLPTASQIEQIHLQAREEGHAAGYQEGIKLAQAEAAHLHALCTELQRDLGHIDDTIAEQLLTLAVVIARQMVRQTIQAQPQYLLPVIREAIAVLPPFSQKIQIALHPDDVTLVHSHFGEELIQESWKLLPDPQLERGGCRVKTGTTVVDATLVARWQRIMTSLGCTQDWLQPSPGHTADPDQGIEQGACRPVQESGT